MNKPILDYKNTQGEALSIDQPDEIPLSISGHLNRFAGLGVDKPNCRLLAADARSALQYLPNESVSCIITSPPYGNLKDYGTTGQIGFGQDRLSEYLPDIQNVLVELYRVGKEGAALWMVLDTMKDAGEMVPLPWEVIVRARKAGWFFHDLVIWDKGRSLPWSHPGRFRSVCEYILLLGKGKLATFNLDQIRETEYLSSYWIKYPERYHPDGKAPTDLWHFPIPTQGSWDRSQTRHSCPFPVGLIARMVSISTSTGDVVLDPFAGTGSVAAVASYMERQGIGIELNPSFVQEFGKTGYDALMRRCQAELENINTTTRPLRQTVIELRMLKYSKTLFAELARADRLNGKARHEIGAFLLSSAQLSADNSEASLDSHNLGTIEVQVLLREDACADAVESAVKQRVLAPPLSKFGLTARVKTIPYSCWIAWREAFDKEQGDWYIYRRGSFYHYDSVIPSSNLVDLFQAEACDTSSKVPCIASQIKLALPSAIAD